MQQTSTLYKIILAIFFIGTLAFAFLWRQSENKLQQHIAATESSRETAAFLALFTSKVLDVEGEVSFEDRLKLENDVRALNDQEIFDDWKKFVESKTAAEAQANLKKLISLLVSRING